MRVIREVYGKLAERKAQYSAVPASAFSEINDLLDRLMGPSPYHGVHLLNRAADYCSERMLIHSTRDNQDFEDWKDATVMLQTMADSLDAYLVADYTEDTNA